MHILLINLDGSKDRLEFQQQQLADLGLTFERITAVAPADLDFNALAPLLDRWERPLKDTEIACMLSHRRCWERVAGYGQPVLVLEDDVLISRFLPEVLAALEEFDGADHLTLEARGRRKLLDREPIALAGRFYLVRLYLDRSGAAGYVLWPGGARKLITAANHAIGLADALICQTATLNSWQVEPAPLIQSDCAALYGVSDPLCSGSMIAKGNKVGYAGQTKATWLGFKWRRVVSQIKMGCRQLKAMGVAKMRQVEVDLT